MTRRSKVFVGSCIAFVVAVMLFLPRWVPWWQSWLTSSPLGESGWSDSGVFGDMFGVANALFSGLALGGVVLAIILQNSELRLQREELALTRFENTFFHMLRLHHEIVAAIQIRSLTAPVHGRECFQDFLKELISPFKADAIYQTKSPGNEDALRQKVDDAYSAFYNTYQADLGHYFRNLYRLVKYVDESAPGDRDHYIGLIRAQISSAEMGCIFYNALSPHGVDKFKPLIEKYALLDNMPPSSIAIAEHARLFDPAAFGRTRPGWLPE